MKKKSIVLLTVLSLNCLISLVTNKIVYADSSNLREYTHVFIYPPSKYSVKEMFEKGTDFAGGKPGKPGNMGKMGKPGNIGKMGKPGNMGKMGK
ncbi:hypothetical protein CUN38_11705 [Enterococcus faecium]|uniref:collagen-like protein n=1 Tax=Enterococcus faecium TaxID=1352 RepID=UPI000CF1234D|nr:collagen-like protein [Enterococcus faecium]PQC90952.1 hypothetical protein CUN38_11705 [Enterococcus faecium]